MEDHSTSFFAPPGAGAATTMHDNEEEKKKVTFSTIMTIRYHKNILGDSPLFVSGGLPLALGQELTELRETVLVSDAPDKSLSLAAWRGGSNGHRRKRMLRQAGVTEESEIQRFKLHGRQQDQQQISSTLLLSYSRRRRAAEAWTVDS